MFGDEFEFRSSGIKARTITDTEHAALTANQPIITTTRPKHTFFVSSIHFEIDQRQIEKENFEQN